MRSWILTSFLILFPARINLLALEVPKIIHLTQKEDLYSFDLDFGLFEIRRAQATVSAQWASVRLPASVAKSGRSKPEIDFVGESLEKAILKKIGTDTAAPGTDTAAQGLSPKGTVPNSGAAVSVPSKKVSVPEIFLASLEQVENRRGAKLAQGEVWLDNSLALRVSLMESKWSPDSYHWWIAYPAQYNEKTHRYEELVVIKDKEFKKKILNVVREAYRSRYD